MPVIQCDICGKHFMFNNELFTKEFEEEYNGWFFQEHEYVNGKCYKDIKGE